VPPQSNDFFAVAAPTSPVAATSYSVTLDSVAAGVVNTIEITPQPTVDIFVSILCRYFINWFSP